MDPPWESGVSNRDGGGERKENQCSLSACQREPSPRGAGTHVTPEARVRAGSLLKGKAECWLTSGSQLPILPTSTTMAEVIGRFPE